MGPTATAPPRCGPTPPTQYPGMTSWLSMRNTSNTGADVPSSCGRDVTGSRGRKSPEDDGAAAVEEDAVLGMPAHGVSQRNPLGVTADGREVFGAVRVVDAGDLLLDDRALVQVGRHVVRGRADQLHAVRVRLVIGPGPLEAGQEGVVDVDDAPGHLGA